MLYTKWMRLEEDSETALDGYLLGNMYSVYIILFNVVPTIPLWSRYFAKSTELILVSKGAGL